jgi:hypothetical protein
VGRACGGGKKKRKERGPRPGASGPHAEDRREGERKDCWLGRAAKEKKERGEEQAGRAGPKGENREGKERGETKQMSLSLKMKLEFKSK